MRKLGAIGYPKLVRAAGGELALHKIVIHGRSMAAALPRLGLPFAIHGPLSRHIFHGLVTVTSAMPSDGNGRKRRARRSSQQLGDCGQRARDHREILWIGLRHNYIPPVRPHANTLSCHLSVHQFPPSCNSSKLRKIDCHSARIRVSRVSRAASRMSCITHPSGWADRARAGSRKPPPRALPARRSKESRCAESTPAHARGTCAQSRHPARAASCRSTDPFDR